jgi:hypothetical protein
MQRFLFMTMAHETTLHHETPHTQDHFEHNKSI